MQVEKLSNSINAKKILTALGVDGGGIGILSSKMKHHIIYIRDLDVGGANILKQDALSIGADLAVPRGTVVAKTPKVDCILIANQKQLKILSKKELAQPFGLKKLAKKLQNILDIKTTSPVEIMGVINANDDSFFAGSRFKDKSAITQIIKMMNDGADIIDIGGASSRPNAKKVSAKDELERIKPIADIIKSNHLYKKSRFSIDSYEPSVISYALESGFSIVNDITGLANDEVSRLCSDYGATAIIMHMQGNPQTMQNKPSYENILSDVYNFLQERVLKAESLGVNDIILDVGIGFGKTLEHNLTLVKHLEHFLALNKRLLVGASRKSMIDKIIDADVENRLSGTLAIHFEAIKNGASILRVHDVSEHNQAIAVAKAFDNI